jgi:O-antigen/teichoic acid export membrane protein
MISIQTDALLAVGRPLATTALAGARMAATVPLTVVLTIEMGVTGAALGVTLGASLQLAVQFGVLRAHLSQPILRLWPIRQLAGLVVAYGAGFGVARVVDSVIAGPLGLVLALSAGALAYPIGLIGVGGMLTRDRRRLERMVAAIAVRSKWAARIRPRPEPSI